MRTQHLTLLIHTRRWLRYVVLLGVLSMLLYTVGVAAQDDLTEVGTVLEPGASITGRIDSARSRQVWYFDGSRGEVIRFQLNVTSGDLDPLLALFDESGSVLFRRDDQGSGRDIDLTVTLRRDTRYFLVVSRFGEALGTTTGDYSLRVDRVGVLSEEGSTLRYGVSVTNRISSEEPEIFYTFRAEAGDILNVDMIRSSGTLDPYVMVVDASRFLLASNDDYSDQTRNARISNLLIEETGTYVVIATRYGQTAGDTAGSFVLTVSESEVSGLGNSELAPANIRPGQIEEGVIDDQRPARYYTFQGRQHDLVTITLDQTSGRLDAYLMLTNANGQSLVEDDDGGSGRNARIDRFRLPTDGTYTIIAMRHLGKDGDSFGGYRLQMRAEGNAFDGVNPAIPRLIYGTTLQDTINDADPDSLFAFWGIAGDTITIFMNRSSGDLDPFLELLDGQQRRILFNDDTSQTSRNARIEGYTLPYTGLYYIRAKRYDGSAGNANTSGTYTLALVSNE